jgi:hypothetical protein
MCVAQNGSNPKKVCAELMHFGPTYWRLQVLYLAISSHAGAYLFSLWITRARTPPKIVKRDALAILFPKHALLRRLRI